jgi:hypothetical protein
MHAMPAHGAWTRWTLGLLSVGALAATGLVAGTQAVGAPGSSSAAPPDAVVLTGSYSCTVLSYSVLPPPPPVPAPTPDPGTNPAPDPETDDPVLVRELSHYVSISGTGALVTPIASQSPSAGPGLGPGFGARSPYGSLPTIPVNLGSGVGTGFDGGTAEDCVRFGQAVAAVANAMGCVTSPVRARQGIPIVIAEARFSFVCEGPVATEIHTVGELDRAVLSQRLASAP